VSGCAPYSRFNPQWHSPLTVLMQYSHCRFFNVCIMVLYVFYVLHCQIVSFLCSPLYFFFVGLWDVARCICCFFCTSFYSYFEHVLVPVRLSWPSANVYYLPLKGYQLSKQLFIIEYIINIVCVYTTWIVCILVY